MIGPRFVKRKETDGSRRFASDDSLQPPDFFRRVITLQISLPPRRVRTDCSSTWYSDAQPWALEALPPHSILESQRWTLTNGFMTKALLRSQDQAPPRARATLPPLPPGNAVRPAGRSRQPPATFLWGGICSVFAVCLSRHPRTREHARCRVGYRIQRWMARCRGALPVGCGCLLLSSSTMRVRWRCCC